MAWRSEPHCWRAMRARGNSGFISTSLQRGGLVGLLIEQPFQRFFLKPLKRLRAFMVDSCHLAEARC
jgi:hypothetical protein